MNKRTIVAAGAAFAGSAVFLRKLGIKEDVDWQSADRPGQLIDIDGYSVHYVDQGAGPAIVLIHGFGGHTYSYRHLIPNFARDHRVIAVDLKGYGYSERNASAGLSRSAQVAMLAALIKKLGVERATFVGHSMGGGIAQRFAIAHPEMVDALVLVASVSGEDVMPRRAMPPGPLVKLVVPVMAQFAASRMLRGSFYDPATLTDDVRDAYMGPVRIKGSMDGLVAIMRDGASDPPIDISTITQPVLLLYGAHDKIVPIEVGQRIRDRITQARMVIVEKAGHLLLEEQPEECVRAIRAFLSEAALPANAAVH
jgi:pimeloyl-ACP methyl ester carboxylesterase